MKKELCLELREAEQELASAINSVMQNHGLPCYLLEPIVDKLHRAVIAGKEQELAEAERKAKEPEKTDGKADE